MYGLIFGLHHVQAIACGKCLVQSLEGEKSSWKIIEQVVIPKTSDGFFTLLDFITKPQGSLYENMIFGSDVAIIGNRRWAEAFAYALKEYDVNPLYFAVTAPSGRGPTGSLEKLLFKMLEAGVAPRPFFRPKPTHAVWPKGEEPTSVRLAQEYFQACDEVRRAKHNLAHKLVTLFPEVVPIVKREVATQTETVEIDFPKVSNLFETKKMAAVLKNPDVLVLRDSDTVSEVVRELAAKSMALYVPLDIRVSAMQQYHNFLSTYLVAKEQKERSLALLHKAVCKHPLYGQFGGGDLIATVLGFLAFQKWAKFGSLISYAGLDVSKIDEKGKKRISRMRPHIRAYLYLLATMTKKGKEVSALPETVKKHKRVKMIDKLLNYLWRNGLRGVSLDDCVTLEEELESSAAA